MAQSVPSSDEPLRMSVETFRARQEAGEVAIVLDVRGPRDWEQSSAKISGALRAYPEIRINPRRFRPASQGFVHPSAMRQGIAQLAMRRGELVVGIDCGLE